MSGRRDLTRFLAVLGLVALTSGAGDDAKNETKDMDRAILVRLDEPIPLKFKNAPLEDVFAFIKSATRGTNNTGIPIHVDPEGLRQAGVTVKTQVTIDSEKVPLKTSLGKLLGPLGLTYRVKDGLLEVTAYVTPPPRLSHVQIIDRGPETRAILAKIEKPVELHFKDAPLEDVLKFIKVSTAGPNDPGIPIHVDPVGLMEAEVTIKSRVTVDAQGEPLRTSLKRLLKPLGLTYAVKDGMLTVTSVDSADE